MKRTRTCLAILIALFVCAATAAQAAKIEICHIPPGNPGNWHTITINANALPAHQAHGDLVGSCLANCDTLCDDGNKCTIDVVPSNTECLCQAATRPPVDCSDGRACTTDSCDPAQGCLYPPGRMPVAGPLYGQRVQRARRHLRRHTRGVSRGSGMQPKQRGLRRHRPTVWQLLSFSR